MPTHISFSALDAAYETLKLHGKLHVRDLTDLMISSGLWSTSGATPWNTVGAAIYKDIKKNPSTTRFKHKGLVFCLKNSKTKPSPSKKPDGKLPNPSSGVSSLASKTQEQHFALTRRKVEVSHTKPTRLEIRGKSFVVSSWKQVLVTIVKHIYIRTPKRLELLVNQPIIHITRRVCLRKNNIGLINGEKVAPYRWLETNYSANACVRLAQYFAQYAQEDLKGIIVYYTKNKKKDLPPPDQTVVTPKNSDVTPKISDVTPKISDVTPKNSDVTPKATTDNTTIIEKCQSILLDYFSNGFHCNSIIEKKKFQRNYQEKYNSSIVLDDLTLNSLLNANCIEISGRIIAISESMESQIRQTVRFFEDSGEKIAYYTLFYKNNMEDLYQSGVLSKEILVPLLKQFFPQFAYTDEYFSVTPEVSLEEEIASRYGDDLALTIEEINVRLPYVDPNAIKKVFTKSNLFVRSKKKYALVDNFLFDSYEVEAVQSQVEKTIAQEGCISLYSLDVSSSKVQNEGVNDHAIAEALFQKFLSSKYDLIKSLIVPAGQEGCACGIIRKYCREHNAVTLNEILQLEREFFRRDSSVSLRVAQKLMVQLDKNHFVSLSQVDFDVSNIDSVIRDLLDKQPNKVLPLYSFKPYFPLFPCVPGYDWTVFLLASFCRHASVEFKYTAQAINNSGVGAVFYKNAAFPSFAHLVAQEAISAKVAFDFDAVADFALNNYYMAQRGTKAINAVMQAMRKICSVEN